jgi:hypothetical protein
MTGRPNFLLDRPSAPCEAARSRRPARSTSASLNRQSRSAASSFLAAREGVTGAHFAQ